LHRADVAQLAEHFHGKEKVRSANLRIGSVKNIQNKKINMATKKPFTKLACATCKTVNYFTKKTKKSALAEKKLEMKKFCKACKKHTPHKESRK
jgi:large subunit ribosomal protein L33